MKIKLLILCFFITSSQVFACDDQNNPFARNPSIYTPFDVINGDLFSDSPVSHEDYCIGRVQEAAMLLQLQAENSQLRQALNRNASLLSATRDLLDVQAAARGRAEAAEAARGRAARQTRLAQKERNAAIGSAIGIGLMTCVVDPLQRNYYKEHFDMTHNQANDQMIKERVSAGFVCGVAAICFAPTALIVPLAVATVSITASAVSLTFDDYIEQDSHDTPTR